MVVDPQYGNDGGQMVYSGSWTADSDDVLHVLQTCHSDAVHTPRHHRPYSG